MLTGRPLANALTSSKGGRPASVFRAGLCMDGCNILQEIFIFQVKLEKMRLYGIFAKDLLLISVMYTNSYLYFLQKRER